MLRRCDGAIAVGRQGCNVSAARPKRARNDLYHGECHAYVAWPGTRAAPALPAPLCPRADRQPGPWRRFRPRDAGGDRRRARRIPARRRSAARPLPHLPCHLVDAPISRKARSRRSAIDGAEGIAQARLARITPLSRQALLLTASKASRPRTPAYLIDATPDDVESLVAEALAEIERQTHADVLIIEDEPIIAMDIEIDRPRPRPQRHRRRRHPRRSGRPGAQVAAGPGAGRHPARRRQLRASTRSRTSSPNSRCR